MPLMRFSPFLTLWHQEEDGAASTLEKIGIKGTWTPKQWREEEPGVRGEREMDGTKAVEGLSCARYDVRHYIHDFIPSPEKYYILSSVYRRENEVPVSSVIQHRCGGTQASHSQSSSGYLGECPQSYDSLPTGGTTLSNFTE